MEVKGMKDVFNKALNHPIGTAILVGTIVSGVTRIIRAIKGNTETPMIKVDVTKNQAE